VVRSNDDRARQVSTLTRATTSADRLKRQRPKDCLEQACASAFSPNDPWRLSDDRKALARTYDGTTFGYAKRVVEEWREANYNFNLPPRVTDDLAERIERAMLWARDG
jgi:hypothetical protein